MKNKELIKKIFAWIVVSFVLLSLVGSSVFYGF